MRQVIRQLHAFINRPIYWLFCRLGDPIYSPSREMLYGYPTCMHCGKCHGTLEEIAESKDVLLLQATESTVGIPDKAIDALAALLNMTRDELLAGIDEEE